jgi:hypothetical protein
MGHARRRDPVPAGTRGQDRGAAVASLLRADRHASEVLDEAASVLADLVAAGVQSTRTSVRVDLDTDKNTIRIRLTIASVPSMNAGRAGLGGPRASLADCEIVHTPRGIEYVAVIPQPEYSAVVAV